MVQEGNILQDSFGDGINHRLDFMVGSRVHGQLVQIDRINYGIGGSVDQVPFSADIAWKLALEGRVFISSDADQNDRVTGQTSFANTTPTFLLSNPANSGVLCIPFYFQVAQTGTVAGGDIGIETEIRGSDAYASGGTTEGVSNARIAMTNPPANMCRLRTGATATAGYGRAVGHLTVAADVSGAEGIINIYEWQSTTGILLDPGSSMLVFTYAGTTGPTWGWHVAWAEAPLARYGRIGQQSDP